MTLFPTHLSLESILFWTFLSDSEKMKFQQKKLLFWLVIAFTIIPDIDIFFGLHRALSHSVIIPTILTIIGTFFYYYYEYIKKNSSNNLTSKNLDNKNNNNNNRSFWGRCVLYGGILWLIHILLDLDFPLAIFFPLSDRLYTLNFAILIDMMPWLIFPVMIVGFIFELTGISYLQGISLYFVNLTPSQRIEIYGREPVALRIDDLFIHLILLIIFLIFVARPMFPQLDFRRVSNWREKLLFDTPIMTIGLILLILGCLLGPMAGIQTVDSNRISGYFRVSETTFSPVLAITFESTKYLLQPNTIYKTRGLLITSSETSPFDHLLLITTRDNYNIFSGSINYLFQKYPFNTSENIADFNMNYQNLLDDFTSQSLSMNSTTFNETSVVKQLNSGSYSLVAIINNWNSTKVLNGTSLTELAQLEVYVTSSRYSLLFIGLFSFISGFGVIFISFKIKK